MKDVGLRIRIDHQLRKCRDQDKPASQVVREFMSEYVAARKREAPKRILKTKK
jgi:hypothetical protein